MGVVSVSAVLQVNSISQAVIDRQLAEREAPQANIFPDWTSNNQFRPLRLEDLEFLQQRLIHLRAISASTWLGPTQTIFQGRETEPSVSVVSEDAFLTSNRLALEGRLFNSTDFANYRPVAVVDQFLADQLFLDSGAVDQEIYVDGRPYTVIGVVPTRVESNISSEGQLFLPMAFQNALTGSDDIGSIQMSPYSLENLENLGIQAEGLLKQRFPGRQFRVFSNIDDILQQQGTLKLASRALTVTGAIALLVGGTGIANIMIASVTERTSEIGIRRALGATRREILAQFILEATLLSLLGGITAIGTVHGLTIAVTNIFQLPYKFESNTVAIALGSALLVGVGFSFFPAWQASKLEPVNALKA